MRTPFSKYTEDMSSVSECSFYTPTERHSTECLAAHECKSTKLLKDTSETHWFRRQETVCGVLVRFQSEKPTTQKLTNSLVDILVSSYTSVGIKSSLKDKKVFQMTLLIQQGHSARGQRWPGHPKYLWQGHPITTSPCKFHHFIPVDPWIWPLFIEEHWMIFLFLLDNIFY